MTEDTILTHDIRDFMAGGDAQQLFVDGVQRSLSTTGFFFLSNHGIPEAVTERVLEVLPAFFRDLSQDERSAYALSDLLGYTPPKVEKGEGFSVPDEKHFVHVRDGVTLYVREVPDFAPALAELSEHFHSLAVLLLRAVALSLELPEWQFDDQEGNNLLRALHYPAHPNPTEHEHALVEGGNAVGMCAAPHTDINMLTLLLAREPGLELFHDGAWMPITIQDPNLLIVNGADVLRHLTGGRYQSGLHRVVCRPGVERYSVPYFVHLKPEAPIVPLEHLGVSDTAAFPFQTSGEFVYARLVELGVIPK